MTYTMPSHKQLMKLILRDLLVNTQIAVQKNMNSKSALDRQNL